MASDKAQGVKVADKAGQLMRSVLSLPVTQQHAVMSTMLGLWILDQHVDTRDMLFHLHVRHLCQLLQNAEDEDA